MHNGIDPGRLSPAKRLAEIAEILAAGLMRLRAPQSSGWCANGTALSTPRDGYEFEGRKYKSLSAIARDITGTRWNSYRFFGLRQVQRQSQ